MKKFKSNHSARENPSNEIKNQIMIRFFSSPGGLLRCTHDVKTETTKKESDGIVFAIGDQIIARWGSEWECLKNSAERGFSLF